MYQKRDPLFSDAFGGKKRDPGNEVAEIQPEKFHTDDVAVQRSRLG